MASDREGRKRIQGHDMFQREEDLASVERLVRTSAICMVRSRYVSKDTEQLLCATKEALERSKELIRRSDDLLRQYRRDFANPKSGDSEGPHLIPKDRTGKP